MERAVKKISVALVALLAIFLSFPKAFADKFNTETAADARTLGMGNAGINLSRGAYGAFYNPANIASKETKTNIQAVNIQVDSSEGLLSQSTAGMLGFQNLTSLYSSLKTTPNTYASGRYSVYPNVTIRNFSVGMLYEVNQGAMFRAYDRALRVKARDRFAPTAAFSTRLLGGIFRLGASAQLLTVGNADKVIAAPVPTALDYKNSITSGSGLVATGGITVTLPVTYLPSFSLVARNLGNTKFSGPPLISFGKAAGTEAQPMTFDWGTSMTFILARRLELKAALDYRDLSNRLMGGRFRHVFTGGELIAFDFLRFRAGLAHGYPSYGIGIDTPKASLDMAIYADELDDRLRGTKEQRYVLQYTWGLFK